MEEVQEHSLEQALAESQDKLKVMNQQSLGETDPMVDQKSDDAGIGEKKKKTAQEKIEEQIEGFDDMIKFMDFSFERAFQQKDKEFMIAYRAHIKEI